MYTSVYVYVLVWAYVCVGVFESEREQGGDHYGELEKSEKWAVTMSFVRIETNKERGRKRRTDRSNDFLKAKISTP